MASFSFLHAADLHLDTPFQGISAEAPHVRELLVDTSLQCWDDLVTLAIERGVAFVVLAGDLYDGAIRGVRAQIRISEGLKRLGACGIRTFIVHGNHDPHQGWYACGRFPESVTLFGSREVCTVSVARDGETIATIHGISFDRPNVEENLAKHFHRTEAPGLHIGVLHCMVGEDPAHGRYSPCSLDDLRAAGMDYWALGHVHARRTLNERTPWVVYPGNLQGRSPKETERGAKGVTLVHCDGSFVERLEFAPLDRVRFEKCDVEISTADSIDGLREMVMTAIDVLTLRSEGRALLVRVRLTGRGVLHAALRGDGARQLLHGLRDITQDRTPLTWIESVQDDTLPALSRDALLTGDNFCSTLLQAFDAMALVDADTQALTADSSFVELQQEIRQVGGELTLFDVPSLLAHAESRALDALEVE